MKLSILATALVTIAFALCSTSYAADPPTLKSGGVASVKNSNDKIISPIDKPVKKTVSKKAAGGGSVMESDKPEHGVKPGPKPDKSIGKAKVGKTASPGRTVGKSDPAPEKKGPEPKPPKSQAKLMMNPGAMQQAPGQAKQ
jgi:hypothetical protein